MKKILDLLKKLTNKNDKKENVFETQDYSKEVLDLNILVNNSLTF